MRLPARLLLAAGIMTLLTGCSYIDTFTGQTNNKVLPGAREDAIPGRSSFPDKPDPQVGTASQPASAGAGCAENDPGCKPPSSTSETFKDPQ
ncbi:hypothetical protein DK847_00300 [Aestuariivirga litoralis]|uniref:Lipoprotein n=1 Tax=Aestuariivirga litoralis TaxID=2650924 RepID=A0A2W2BDI7_9HYPH|nr:hypothetical protein [Aestuariivirga litoralis]PZF78304.1 hypothetical protein DK847_00300 [Aestuariivirga litoralis]